MKRVQWHVWPGAVYFILNDSDLEVAKKKLSEHIYNELLDMKGHGVTLSVGTTSIVRLTSKDPSVVAHECFHAVNHIMSYIGIENNNALDEAFAYSLQYLVEQHRLLTQKKAKKK